MSQRDSLEGIRVLIVEDDPIIALDMIYSLEDAGAETIGPCVTTARALAQIADDAPDVAILDVDIGSEDSGPVARVLRARGIPFVFHTGTLPQGNQLLAESDAPVLGKPTRPDDLLAALKSVLPGEAVETS